MKFIVDNLLDYNATITSNDEDTYNPVSNIIVKTLADYYQTQAAGAKEIQITLTETVAIKEVALVYHNLEAGDTAVLESYPDADGFSGTPIQQSLTIRDGIIYFYSDVSVFHNTKYYKLVITKNIGTYFKLGFLFLGDDYFQADHNAGALPKVQSNTQISESRGFQGYTARGVSRKVITFAFNTKLEQYECLYDMYNDFEKVPGVCLPTHKALDANEPYFGYLTNYNVGSRDHDRYIYSVDVPEVK